jgi:hypothetical protein
VNAELIEEFRSYIQSRLDDLGDDNPFGQSDEDWVVCAELHKALVKFESLLGGNGDASRG